MQAIHSEYRQISERSTLIVHSGFVKITKQQQKNERSISFFFKI